MGRPLIDLTGKVFGSLTVVSFGGRGHKCTWWDCVCSCGKAVSVRSHFLRHKTNPTMSCQSCASKTHGATIGGRSPEYIAWLNMRQRCNDPNVPEHKYYGGRGIAVCDRWLHGEAGLSGYECFLADMGNKPSRLHSIDRIDVNGNYEPGNCRWATKVQQARNTRSNRIVQINGVSMPLVEACESLGENYRNVRQRIYRGKTFEQAVGLQQ